CLRVVRPGAHRAQRPAHELRLHRRRRLLLAQLDQRPVHDPPHVREGPRLSAEDDQHHRELRQSGDRRRGAKPRAGRPAAGSVAGSVVNQHKGTIEADAYSAAATGASTVYLPNVVRRFFGFHSPAIIQNLGPASTVATATYRSFDGSAPTMTFTRTIAPGQSKFIQPNSHDPSLGAAGRVRGNEYAVTITSGAPVSVVLNTHNDDPGVAQPVFYSANGISTGAGTVYGAYAVKNANGGRVSTIVVQNLSAGPLTPSLTFTPLT